VRAQTAAGFGPFSDPMPVKTTVVNDNTSAGTGNNSSPTQGINVPVVAIEILTIKYWKEKLAVFFSNPVPEIMHEK